MLGPVPDQRLCHPSFAPISCNSGSRYQQTAEGLVVSATIAESDSKSLLLQPTMLRIPTRESIVCSDDETHLEPSDSTISDSVIPIPDSTLGGIVESMKVYEESSIVRACELERAAERRND